MDDDVIRQIRSFNRTVAERVGVFGDRFLGLARPYGESRVLWEIGPEGSEIRALRSRLGLDSGYVSRVLRSLERHGLVTVEASLTDRRVRRITPTALGLAECAEIDRRSDAVARGFLEPLAEAQQERLVAAMADVERLLRASQVTFAVEDPATPGAWWCVEQYIAELNVRFDAGWDPAQSISAAPDELMPPNGLLVVARLKQQPSGCAALKFHGDAPAELKRMWVSREARGLGLGRRLLLEMERQARESGVTVLRLETNRSLTEAITLYRSSGYQEVPAFNDVPYADHWFEKRLA